MRQFVALGLILLLSGCVSERHFTEDLWPFGNPNAPPIQSETAQRAIGRQVAITPIAPQAGDVWPGPVEPMPTLGDVQNNANVPLGQGYTPSLPSPYPPGQDPADQLPPPVLPPGSIYPSPPSSPAAPGSTN